MERKRDSNVRGFSEKARTEGVIGRDRIVIVVTVVAGLGMRPIVKLFQYKSYWNRSVLISDAFTGLHETDVWIVVEAIRFVQYRVLDNLMIEV